MSEFVVKVGRKMTLPGLWFGQFGQWMSISASENFWEDSFSEI